MKKIIALSLCFLFAITSMVEAQEQNRRKFSPEAYKAKMEEFISKEACLTKEEGEKFFPMLHEMMGKQREVNRESHRISRERKTASTDEDYRKIINTLTDLDIKSKQIEKEYYMKFNNVLSWEKVLKVRNALQKFNMEALKRFTPQRNGDNRRPNRNAPR